MIPEHEGNIVALINNEKIHAAFFLERSKAPIVYELHIFLERGQSLEHAQFTYDGKVAALKTMSTDGFPVPPQLMPVVIGNHLNEFNEIPNYRPFVPALEQFVEQYLQDSYVN